MVSQAYQAALGKTGYLVSGKPAAGLISDASFVEPHQAAFDEKVGLKATSVFKSQATLTTIFKDAGNAEPHPKTVNEWREVAWNLTLAPLLWIVTPTVVRIYSCYDSPRTDSKNDTAEIGRFHINKDSDIRKLNEQCGRLATETGAFWSSKIGMKINRASRVDRTLLAEIASLESLLLESHSELPQDATKNQGLAQRFIGRCIFTWYLLDRGIAHPFLNGIPHDLGKMLRTRESAFELFHWLRSTFNGDLFPMDSPGDEEMFLTDDRLKLLQDFAACRSLIPEQRGQGRLFRFRFNAIPIELISSIYQQFARSASAHKAKKEALHYTPPELVHLTLDPVFEGLQPNARIIDPTCGSGLFLVEAFRRLVWLSSEAKAKPIDRETIRHILYNQLYGIDINRSALGIAAFSLYLAALELDSEPILRKEELRFDHLIGNTLFETDALANELPTIISSKTFDAVIGNPPWTFVRNNQPPPARNRQSALHRRSPDQQFLERAHDLAGESGRVGLIMKATPFFSQDNQAIEARIRFLKCFAPTALVNLSNLRKDKLFPNADGPALLFFARCLNMASSDNVLVGSIPWTSDFRRTGIFQVGHGEIRPVPLKSILSTTPLLKAAAFGTPRDMWLIERLVHNFPKLEEVLEDIGIGKDRRGQGYQVVGSSKPVPSDYKKMAVLTTQHKRKDEKVQNSHVYSPFRLEKSMVPSKFEYESLHSPRNISIFLGPLLICPKNAGSSGVERGRYGTAVYDGNILYSESFYGMSFRNSRPEAAHALCAIMNSSLTTFQLLMGGSTWGVERATVPPGDIMSLRVPAFTKNNQKLIDKIVALESKVAKGWHSPDLLAQLDKAVFDLYGLDPDERILAKESVSHARPSIFESKKERSMGTKPPSKEQLGNYAGQVTRTINAYLLARGERHLEAMTYEPSSYRKTLPGVRVVGFRMRLGPPSKRRVIRRGNQNDVDAFLRSFSDFTNPNNVAPYLNERRHLMVYREHDLLVVKPEESRCWTSASGLCDADSILAQHWIGS